MHKSVFLFCLSMFVFLQNSYSQSVTFRTQADIDTFDQSITEVFSLKIGASTGTNDTTFSDIIDLSNLSNITEAYRLDVRRCPHLKNLEGLNNINSISLIDIWDNDSLQNIDALGNVSGYVSDVTVRSNELLANIDGLGNISEVVDLSIRSNPNLENVDGLEEVALLNDIEIVYNPLLENLDGLSNIDSFIYRLDIEHNDNLKNLDGLSALTSVFRHIDIIGNESLENLDALQNVSVETQPVMSVEISKNDNLKNLDALSGLVIINGNLSISENPKLANIQGLSNVTFVKNDLDILYNDNLQNLQGLDNLTFAGDLSIVGNKRLKGLHGLERLSEVEESVYIILNDSLLTLRGIQNISSIGEDLFIIDNPQLDNCCSIYKWKNNWFLSVEDEIRIFGNQDNCRSISSIRSFCEKPKFEGNVFYDKNKDGVQDESEFGIPGAIINVLETDLVTTNQEGVFSSVAQQEASYTLSLELGSDWQLSTDSLTYSFVYDLENRPDIKFGLYYPEPICSANVSISAEETRCNTETEFHISVVNTGSTYESGEVRIKLDSLLSFVSSSVAILEIDEFLVHRFDTLSPFGTIDIVVTVDMPSQIFTGEIISLKGEVYYEQEGNIVLKDETLHEEIVLCSYDPNDKLVSPVGRYDENYTLIEDELSYTIRFQNTGNAPAIDVRILDTIDQNLDLETFKVTQSSFPVFTSVKDRAVEFLFEDIWLVDSLSNEPESHGFINYSISVRDDIEDYTAVTNTAHIIFDFNPPIVTNTTFNTMVEEYPSTSTTNETESTFTKVFPNPTTGLVYFHNIEQRLFQLLDLSGKVLEETKSNTTDMRHLPSGIYIIREVSDTTSYPHKVVKQ